MTDRSHEPESFDQEVVAMAHQLVDGLNLPPASRDAALSYVYHRLDRLLRAWRARKRWADRDRLRKALVPSPN